METFAPALDVNANEAPLTLSLRQEFSPVLHFNPAVDFPVLSDETLLGEDGGSVGVPDQAPLQPAAVTDVQARSAKPQYGAVPDPTPDPKEVIGPLTAMPPLVRPAAPDLTFGGVLAWNGHPMTAASLEAVRTLTVTVSPTASARGAAASMAPVPEPSAVALLAASLLVAAVGRLVIRRSTASFGR